jgi:outer membrane protein TolC
MSLAWMLALAVATADGPKPVASPIPTAPGAETWRLTLTDAIRIGVKNCENLKVVEQGDSLRIARVNADASVWNFKAAVMAHVRSIVQQYWALVTEDVRVWARERAVQLCAEVVRKETADASGPRGPRTNLAEARANLERFRLALAAAESDRITTERQLRSILGLPPSDSRRIVPATAPTEAEVEPDWERCLAAMQEEQPDIRLQRELVAEAEARADRSGAADSPDPVGLPVGVAAAFEAQRQTFAAARQREFLQQVVHNATHTLARFFLEIDANYKQFQTARRLREAAQARLDAARQYYQGGARRLHGRPAPRRDRPVFRRGGPGGAIQVLL